VPSSGTSADSPLAIFPEQRLPTLKQVSDLLVKEAMQRSNGNQSIAAGMLGISQQALSKRLKKKNII
jgi:transcriptional regulator with PAS, ATPase and Fis domain